MLRYAGLHQSGQRVIDHRFVVDRLQLLAGNPGHRVEPGPGPSREDDALHGVAFSVVASPRGFYTNRWCHRDARRRSGLAPRAERPIFEITA